MSLTLEERKLVAEACRNYPKGHGTSWKARASDGIGGYCWVD